MPESIRMLVGVKVIELSRDLGAGFCGQQLSMLGADVVRLVDEEGWLPTRDESAPAGSGRSASEVGLDRFKTRRRLVGDAAAKRAALKEALASADVLITDATADELRELGVHWDDTARSERLIHVHISAFGASGPYAGWTGGDLEAQALGGVIAQVGYPDQSPLPLPYKAGLIHAGLQATGATTAALYARRASGLGGFIDIAAAQVLAADVRMYSLLSRYYGLPLKRSGRRPPGSMGNYPCAIFPCKDGYVVLIIRAGEQWRTMLAMMGSPAWGDDPKYQNSFKNAIHYADELDALMIPWLMQYTRAELIAKGIENRCPIGAVQTLAQVLDNEQYEWRGFFDTVEVDGKTVAVPGSPAQVTAKSVVGAMSHR